jgi:hypothetical protein
MTKRKLPTRKRSSESFRRREAIYSAGETILIVCEGETEVKYFNALKKYYRISSMMARLSESGSAPINVVEYAIELVENNEAIDRVYCVFDQDQHSTYDQAIFRIENYQPPAGAKSKPVFKVITSVPCFEIWLLLHFKYTTKPYAQKSNISPADQVIRELRKHVPDYLKSSLVWFDNLHRKHLKALKNAERLKKENNKTGSNNPATDVHELVNYLINTDEK